MPLGALTDAIAYEESGGNYGALGRVTKSGDRAYGKYQVMGANIPQWTRDALGFSLTPEQFLKSSLAQDTVARVKLGQYLASTGSPADAASMWFTGKPAAEGASLRDANGMTGARYVENVMRNMKGGAASLSALPDQDILGEALNPVAAAVAGQAAAGIAPKAPAPLSAPSLNALPTQDILGEALASEPNVGQTASPAPAPALPAPPAAPVVNPYVSAMRATAAQNASSTSPASGDQGGGFASWLSRTAPELTEPGGGLDVMNSIPVLGPGILAAGAGANALINGDSYAAEREQQQQQMAQFNAANPRTAMGANIAGGLVGAIPAALAAPALFGADAGAGFLTNALAGGAGGGVLSGADTAIRGGTPEQVGRNALLGAALGGGGSLVGSTLSGLGRGLTGGMMSADDATLANLARSKYDIPLNAGDLAGPNSVGKFAASASNRLPFSGAAAFEASQQGAFNRAVAQTIGADSTKLTPAVMSAAKARIGDVFESVAAHTSIKADTTFDDAVQNIMSDAGKELSTDELRPLNNIFENVIDKIDPKTFTIDGSTYQAITRANTPLGRALSSPNPNIGYYAGQIKDALDDALTRSAAPEDVAALDQAKDQWRNLKTIEPLVARGGGNISPGGLAQAINGSRFSKNALAYGGGGDLGELAQIGTRFLREPQSSGTAERGAAYAALAEVPTAVGSILAGHPLGGAAVPAFLAANRGANALLRSSWLTNSLINRSLPGAAPGVFRPAATGAIAGAGNALLQAAP